MAEEHDQDPPENEDGDRNWKQVRSQLSRLEKENSALRVQALRGVVREAGFNPDAGPTRLLVEKFESAFAPGETDADSFVEFAKGYDLTPAAPEPEQEDRTNEQQMDRLQGRADRLQSAGAVSEEPDEYAEALAKAEASGDLGSILSLKLRQVTEAD